MFEDKDWLKPYENEFRDKNVLEIGSGLGEDTKELLKLTDKITSLDIDKKRIENLRSDLPQVDFYCIDLRSNLPFQSNTFDVILASLSLHYFTVVETLSIFKEIKRVLKPDCRMIVRLNSIDDKNYGSEGHPEIEHHLFKVDGQYKRFFDKKDIHTIFGDEWEISKPVEKTIDRYELPKIVWEFVSKSV